MRHKKYGQRIHAKRRAFERFGINFNRDNLKDMVHMIQRQLGIFVLKISGSKTSWALSYKNKKFYVVYDKNTKNIATIMPLEYAVSDLMKQVEDELRVWVGYPKKILNVYPENVERVSQYVNLAATLLNERMNENVTGK